ncbi:MULTISPECIES: glycosyl hydrolase family 28-related protein [unclassified Luteococcus]|uniref:glycosyl hydrolase family 28-related protein n=1 Tax=unclassified Luteococcus TaxID=2639923 RepID=UPI00313D650A
MAVSTLIPAADLVPSVPSRIVTIDVTEMTEGAPADGRVTLTLPCDLYVPGDRKIIQAGSETLTLADGKGEIRLPCWAPDAIANDDWMIYVHKSWAPRAYPIRVPAGDGPISLAEIPEVRALKKPKDWKYALTGIAVTVVEGGAWGATAGEPKGGIAPITITVPPAATPWSKGEIAVQSSLDTLPEGLHRVSTDERAQTLRSAGGPLPSQTAAEVEVLGNGKSRVQRWTSISPDHPGVWQRIMSDGVWRDWRRIDGDQTVMPITMGTTTVATDGAPAVTMRQVNGERVLDWRLVRGPEGPAGGTAVTDPQVAGMINSPTPTETQKAADARYLRPADADAKFVAVQTAAKTIAAQPGYNPLLGGFVVEAYGADPTGQLDSTQAIQAAMDAAGQWLMAAVSPGIPAAKVWATGSYRVEGTLEPRSRVTLAGASPDSSRLMGKGTRLMATPVGGTVSAQKTVTAFRAESISFECETGPAWDIQGGFYDGLSRPSFVNCRFWTSTVNAPVWRHRGTAQMIWGSFDRCFFENRASSPTNRAAHPLIDVVVDAGNLWNSNTYKDCVVEARYSARPAIYVACTNGGLLWHNVFDHVTGEHCAGGLIHLAGAADFVIESCPEWDTDAALMPTYTGDIFNFSAYGVQQNFCWGEIRRSYRIVAGNAATLGASVYDIKALSGTPTYTGRKGVRIVDCDPAASIPAKLLVNGSVEVVGRTRPLKIVTTGPYTLSDTDPDLVIINSADPVTVNLPPSTTAIYGRTFTVKNAGAGAVTIPQGVDGLGVTLTKGQVITVVTDGAVGPSRTWWRIA